MVTDQGIQGVIYRVPTGEPLSIPRRHLAVFGVTRDSGKTTFIESAVAASGMKAIVFRTKRGEIGFDNAKPLPLFFDERGLTHWKALEGLIAATLEEKVQREPGVRYAIISVCKNPTPAKSLVEIHQRVKDKLKDPRLKEFIKEVFTKLDAYLEEVLPQLEKLRGKFSDRLELPEPGVYVEDLEGLGVKTDELQNLFVASLIRKAYEELSGIIIVVAEIWKFLPQDRGSPVKWVIEKYVREMGVVEGWLWLDAQDLRGVDKKHLRSFDVRLFGRQPDAHEIDEILKALPLPKQQKPKPEQIMTLKLGHFYAKLRDQVELVYVRPVWLPESVAIRVAKGELEPDSEEVQRYKPEPKLRVLEEDEMVWKDKCEKLEERIANLEGQVEGYKLRAEAAEKDRGELFQELADLNKELEQHRKQVSEEARLEDDLKKANEEIDRLKKESGAFQKLKVALSELLPASTPLPVPGTGISEVSLEHGEVIFKVQNTAPQTRRLTTDTVLGKIMFVAIKDLKDNWTEKELADSMRERSWSIGHSTLAPSLGNLVKDGLLIGFREPGKATQYRLPQKARIEIEEV